MKFGAITNSWRENLKSEGLTTLVARAQDRGAHHIELRQTCLGDCETGEGEHWRPVNSSLSELVADFPSMSFNLAIAWPCLSRAADPEGEQFQAALEAARVVSPEHPHLRMVDSARFDSLWDNPSDIPETALSLARLVDEAASQGVTLSIENSGQPIRSLEMLVRAVRATLPEERAQYLGLCPDPTNQLRVDPQSDPVGEVEQLPVDMIKIVHFKQTRDGAALPAVEPGDVDCLRMLKSLRSKGYDGPAIMEIPPHADVFGNLSASFTFLSDTAGLSPN